MKILIVIKHSKFEWEQKILDLTEQEMLDKLEDEKANVTTIIQSHLQQTDMRSAITSTFTGADIVMMDEINDDIQGYDLVIVLGGDNSFTKISHHVNDIPILGVNSDPKRSMGCLTSWAASDESDIAELYKKIINKDFSLQKWTRLLAILDGKILPLATSEIYLGEKRRTNMSRHILQYKQKSYEQKCSGIIVATGVGSTGWYNSATDLMPWDKESKQIRFAITEPYNQIDRDECYGYIGEYENISVHSLNDEEGIISIDSWEEYKFRRGSTVNIMLGKPLNVVLPNKD